MNKNNPIPIHEKRLMRAEALGAKLASDIFYLYEKELGPLELVGIQIMVCAALIHIWDHSYKVASKKEVLKLIDLFIQAINKAREELNGEK